MRSGPHVVSVSFQIQRHEGMGCRHMCTNFKKKKDKEEDSFPKLSDSFHERIKRRNRDEGSESSVASGGGSGHGNDVKGKISRTKSVRDKMRDIFLPTKAQNTAADVQQQEKWLMIYRFEHIVALKTICRFKLYHTMLTTGFGIATYYSYLVQGSTETTSLFYVTGILGFTLVSLFIVTNSLRRVIGIVYTNPDVSHVKISHLGSWGKRENRVSRVTDIVPLSNTPDDSPLARPLFVSGVPFGYYILMKQFGDFKNPELFAAIFGIDVQTLVSYSSRNMTQSDPEKQQ